MSNTLKDDKSSWVNKYLYPQIATIITTIITAILTTLLTVKVLNPPPLPFIESTVAYNSGTPTEIEAPFKLDPGVDKDHWLVASISNNGHNDAEKFEVGFYLLKQHNLLKVTKKYNPKFLEDRVTTSKQELNRFYEQISSLPSDSSIQYEFYFDKFIKSEDEYELSVCSKSKNWSKSTVIKPKYSKSETSIATVAHAEDKAINDRQPDVPRSGILIGGYDPIVMSNEVFLLSQSKNLISKDQAAQIKKAVESYKEGVLFGGVNILKFNELIINGLLSNRIITIDQANSAVEKSKQAGGVMVGGYNVIALQVEILNLLLKNKKITYEEGQAVIDRSKPK